jgi:ABC-type Fe3+-siderophore transport system permease subunit
MARLITFGQSAAMILRLVAATAWFYAAWTLGSLGRTAWGTPESLGVIAGTLLAVAIVTGPWFKSVRLSASRASNRQHSGTPVAGHSSPTR